MTALFDLPDAEPEDAVVIGFEVLGTPTTQGSKKPFIHKHTGRPMMKEQLDKALDRWRGDVMRAARDAMGDSWTRLDGDLRVTAVFRFERPKYHYRTGSRSHELRDDAPYWAGKTKDLDKLLRAVGDAMTAAGLYRDDKQICDFGQSKKIYCAPGEVAGVTIVVSEL